jgi:basic membrane protein A and related proteins
LRGKKLALAAAVAALALTGLAGGAFAMTNLSSAKAPAKAAKADATFKVGLVTDIGGLNDRGFNQLANQGLQRAIKQLKVQGRVLISQSEQDYIPNFTSLVRAGYNLIIGVGFLQTKSLNTMALRFPRSHFAGVDVGIKDTNDKPKNYEGLLFKEQEVGYLAGYLAALKAKNSGRVVSSVGGIKLPSVDRFIAGYQAGAKKAVPGTKTLNSYSQDFGDQQKCKEIALSQIGQGSRVVFQVAGGCGLGAIEAAKSKGVCGIGVDNDQRFLGPQVLTSARKKVDQAVYLAIKAAKSGKYKGGKDVVYGLKNGGVALGKFGGGNCAVTAAQKAAVAKIAKQIVAGKIKPPAVVTGG